MSISYFFSGLGKLIFSTKKIAKIKTSIAKNNFTSILNKELPKLGCLLYLSCILLELI